jgi:hypothetical protein
MHDKRVYYSKKKKKNTLNSLKNGNTVKIQNSIREAADNVLPFKFGSTPVYFIRVSKLKINSAEHRFVSLYVRHQTETSTLANIQNRGCDILIVGVETYKPSLLRTAAGLIHD